MSSQRVKHLMSADWSETHTDIWIYAYLDIPQQTFQRCFKVVFRLITSNQRWKNVVYINDGIYNVEQRPISVAYFNVDLNNVRQRRNNFVIFNFQFYNVGEHRNNVVNMIIWRKSRGKHNNNYLNWIQWSQIFFALFPMLTGICRRIFAKAQQLLKHREYTELQKLYLNHLMSIGF